jgi:hypothetical protein
VLGGSAYSVELALLSMVCGEPRDERRWLYAFRLCRCHFEIETEYITKSKMYMAIFLLFLLIAAIVVISLVCIINSNNTDSTQSPQLHAENTRAVSNWKQKRKENFDVWIESMKNKYGEIEVMVPIIPSEPQKTVLVFKEKQEIYFSSSWLKFKDINNSQIVDNPRIEAGTVVAETKGDLWNEIKRSSMQQTFGKTTGTLLAGPEKYTTEYQKKPDKIYHNYSVIISTLNISHPIFEIHVGDNEQTAHRINAIINAIITHQHNK